MGAFERLDAVLLLGVYMLAPLLLFGFVAAFVLFLLGEPVFRSSVLVVFGLDLHPDRRSAGNDFRNGIFRRR